MPLLELRELFGQICFQTGRFPTCHTSNDHWYDEIGLARAAAEEDIAEVTRLLEGGSPAHSKKSNRLDAPSASCVSRP